MVNQKKPVAEKPLILSMLLCHKHVDMSMLLIPSLQRNLQDDHVLWVFDDGSLTKDDLERVQSTLAPERIVGIEEADDLVLPKLKKFPACRRLREKHVVMRKLLDMPLIADQSLAIVDSDVTAVTPFSGLDRRGRGNEPIALMIDYGEAYSMTYRHRHFGQNRVPLIDRANTGFLFVNHEFYDLAFFENFVSSENNISRSSWLIEQTAWAAHAARVGSAYFDPAQVSMPPRSPDQPPIGSVIHFISRLRHTLDQPQYLEQLFETGRQQPHCELATLPTVSSGFVSGLVKKTFNRAVERKRYVMSV